MTVEKAVVASWTRTDGCRTDEQRRAFATALSRKRARFAFPDDFVAAARQLQDRLADKHGSRRTKELIGGRYGKSEFEPHPPGTTIRCI